MAKYILILIVLVFAYNIAKILWDVLRDRAESHKEDETDDEIWSMQQDRLGTLADPYMNDRVGGAQYIDTGRMIDIKADDGIKPLDSDLLQHD